MIRLPPRPAVPAVLEEKQVAALVEKVSTFYSVPEKSRRQHKFEFPLLPDRVFTATLNHLLQYTSGKCAYCEMPIEEGRDISLDRFRPKAGALDKDGSFSTEHYWWLAFEWRNLYPCCVPCNKIKGSKFPMRGARAKPGTPYGQLAGESKLLLDPASDEPQLHLAFARDGMVSATTEQGAATIATLDLNRGELVHGRRQTAQRTDRLLQQDTRIAGALLEWGDKWWGVMRDKMREDSKLEEWLYPLAGLVADGAPYAATTRSIVWQFIAERSAATAQATPGSASRPAAAARPSKAIKPTAPSLSALHSQTITRIQLKSFRGIADLDLPIDYSVGIGAPWTVVLGENGAGKSSILQAVALTLLRKDSDMPAVQPRMVLRKGASSGYVRVWFHGNDTPRELSFRRKARRFERKGPQYYGTLLGYGATRLLPRRHVQSKRNSVRLDNMFDPFQPLIDANGWLGNLQKRDFDFVARALRDVLGLPQSSTLRRVRARGERGVRLKQHGADLTLQDLSDGYQSALGLTCDIIASLRVLHSGALDASEAVVLIDELGAHLHPRWRMRIVTSLRKAFKRVQFIGSTHDPLVLRGLENGEAVVLRRTERGRVYRVADLPPVKGLRVDQLLTSEFFGLDSTLDPAIEANYRELYRLLAVRNHSEKVETRIGELRELLAPYDVPGATRRERRLLQVIDRELAQIDATPDPAGHEQIRAENEAIMNALLRPSASEATA